MDLDSEAAIEYFPSKGVGHNSVVASFQNHLKL